MEFKRFAAIDIGSNAIRLLVVNVLKDGKKVDFSKATLVRLPIRLGQDAFSLGEISEKTKNKLIKAISAYKLLMDIYEVNSYRACATSAMREAKNGDQIIQAVKDQTGISIEIISGSDEAKMIFSTHIDDLLDHEKIYLYVDVGGGSTELTLFRGNEILASQSFDIGTVRVLQLKVPSGERQKMRAWLKENTKKFHPTQIIGSGGNINKLVKLSTSKKKDEKNINYSQLEDIYEELNALSVEDRMKKFQLNPDRADVIVPAAEIFLNVMQWSNCKKVFVPKIGISDGIIRNLVEKKLGITSYSSVE